MAPSTCIRTKKDSWAACVKLQVLKAAVYCDQKGLLHVCLQRPVGSVTKVLQSPLDVLLRNGKFPFTETNSVVSSIQNKVVLSGSLLDGLLSTLRGSEGSRDTFLCTSTAEVVCQGHYLARAQNIDVQLLLQQFRRHLKLIPGVYNETKQLRYSQGGAYIYTNLYIVCHTLLFFFCRSGSSVQD